MSNSQNFHQSFWNDVTFVQKYLNDSDTYFPQRKTVLSMIQFIYQNLLKKTNKNHHIVDFGCGSGIISQILLRVDPDIQITLVDGSLKIMGFSSILILCSPHPEPWRNLNCSYGKNGLLNPRLH